MKQPNEVIEQNVINVVENVQTALKLAKRNGTNFNVMAVTKNSTAEQANAVYHFGITLFGENRVQEFLEKYDSYIFKKNNIHFIGHLQTNKVKYIIDKVSMIESVDSVKLAEEINKCALQNNLVMDILLEINVANEPEKSGFLYDDVMAAITEITKLSNVRICGLMCIPPKQSSERFFKKMKKFFKNCQKDIPENADFKYLSMGMSGDYEKAIQYDSNIIRLGRAIFGE